jgi:hypothetical protein
MEPTPEQVAEWNRLAFHAALGVKYGLSGSIEDKRSEAARSEFARLAYAAGADAELEACSEYLYQHAAPNRLALLAHRRPKPLSLKEKAVEAFRRRYPERRYFDDGTGNAVEVNPELFADLETIRRALESLPDD